MTFVRTQALKETRRRELTVTKSNRDKTFPFLGFATLTLIVNVGKPLDDFPEKFPDSFDVFMQFARVNGVTQS